MFKRLNDISALPNKDKEHIFYTIDGLISLLNCKLCKTIKLHYCSFIVYLFIPYSPKKIDFLYLLVLDKSQIRYSQKASKRIASISSYSKKTK
jgi:hypothetical protein